MERRHQHNTPPSPGETQIPNGTADQSPISGDETLPPTVPECLEAPTDEERRRRRFGLRVLDVAHRYLTNTGTSRPREAGRGKMSIFTRSPRVRAGAEHSRAHTMPERSPITPDDLIAPANLYNDRKDLPIVRSADDCEEGELPVRVRLPRNLFCELTAEPPKVKISAEAQRRRAAAYRDLADYLASCRSVLTPANIHAITEEAVGSADIERARRSLISLQVEADREMRRLLESSRYLQFGGSYDWYVDTPTR